MLGGAVDRYCVWVVPTQMVEDRGAIRADQARPNAVLGVATVAVGAAVRRTKLRARDGVTLKGLASVDACLTGVTHHVGAWVLSPLEREITSRQDDLEVAEVNLLCNRSNHGVLVVA